MTMTVTPDTEMTLDFGDQRAVISPWGASLRRYVRIIDGQTVDIVWGYSGGAGKKGGQGDVLIPFPGRVADGRYVFDGEAFQLERNDKEGPNAIHGFVRTLPWVVAAQEANRALFEVSLTAEHYASKGYPFSLRTRVSYELNEQGLTCSFEVRNIGERIAPVGVGFHPYFTVGSSVIDDDVVRIPGAASLEFNERLAPTGRIIPVAGTKWDYRTARPIGARRFNHCYVQLERDAEGSATATLRHARSGRTIEVRMDRSFSAVVIYTGDAIAGAARRAVAIEPMTCASDAFNHPEWGLQSLPPGGTFSGRYTVYHHV
jgi:aldose 1-epimerase